MPEAASSATLASGGTGRGAVLWGLTLNAWDALIPLFFAISAIFAILGGSATYVAFKLHKQEALNANEDLKRYELALDAKIDAAKAKGLAAEQAVKDANAAEANRRAAKAASSLEHKPAEHSRAIRRNPNVASFEGIRGSGISFVRRAGQCLNRTGLKDRRHAPSVRLAT